MSTRNLTRSVIVLATAVLMGTATLALADTSVRGHYRGSGTYVQPHYRSSPNYTTRDNWSTRGNVNPYTGEVGRKSPYLGSDDARPYPVYPYQRR